MGYSLIRTAPNYIGKLKQSQLHLLFDGYSGIQKREADAIKKSGKSGNRVEAGMHNVHKVPGVKVVKRKR